MYGKSFESLFTGSMYGAGMNVFAVWGYVITMTHHGHIELNPKALADVLGGTVEEVEKALRYLTRPDENSRSKTEDGRRLVKEGQFQYRVVNWEFYQRIKSEEHRREYNRRKQAEHRLKKRMSAPDGRESAAVMAFEEGDTERFDRLSEPRAGGVP